MRNGDVESWDITILTNVLLNFPSSKLSSEERKQEQDHLRTLKEVSKIQVRFLGQPEGLPG